MTEERLKAEIDALADEKNKIFFSRLSHSAYSMNGARIPQLRKLAKEFVKSGEAADVLAMPTLCYEHLMLKGILIASAKTDLCAKLAMLDGYCSEIDDWALCDVACSCLKFNKKEEFAAMAEFAASSSPFKARFGLIAIESCFCSREYASAIADVVRSVRAQGYYVDMGAAWLVCTLEGKVKGAGVEILLSGSMSDPAAAMCAGKMRDSRRVDDETARRAADYVKNKRANKTQLR